MPCIPVEHVRHPSIYLHAHSIIFNPSTWHNHQQQQHCCHPPRPCPESSAMEKRMEISQIRTYPQPPTQFPVSNRRRPSLVNSFPFPCHSVLPSSSRRSQRISRPSISIAVVPPINKISLWPWEPTPLYLQLQRHFLPIWHWNLNRIHLLIVICRKQSSLHCLFVL